MEESIQEQHATSGGPQPQDMYPKEPKTEITIQKEPVDEVGPQPQKIFSKGPIPAVSVTIGPIDKQSLSSQRDGIVPQVNDRAPVISISNNLVDEAAYPEGGLRAWLVVLGSFMATFVSAGVINSTGTFQAYISTHQLQGYSQVQIGWIFSMTMFVAFACGLPIGPIFDARGPRLLLVAGSIILVSMMVLLALCKEFYQFFLVFGILGLGSILVYYPAFAAIGHFFYRRRGTATGIAMGGGALGGVIFPLMLEELFTRVGYAWSCWILALVFFICCLFTVLVRSRLPPMPGSNVLPDFRIFRNGAFAVTTVGVCFIEIALFTPLAYLTLFGEESHAMSNSFAYQILAIFNAASFVGNCLSGFCADSIGRYNSMLLFEIFCICSSLGMWLPSAVLVISMPGSPAIMPLAVGFSLLFGLASGAVLTLTPVCIGQLCATEEYGRYYATCYAVVSCFILTGIPIGGALISACGGAYWGVALFPGACFIASFICFASARAMKVGCAIKIKY